MTATVYRHIYPIVWARIPGRPRRTSAIVVSRSPESVRIYAPDGRCYDLPRDQISRPRRNVLAQAIGLRLAAEYARILTLKNGLQPHSQGRIPQRPAR